jgi:pyruvate kinase
MPTRRTKIIATVGPACQETETLAQLIQAGVNVFRLNMAHGDMESHTLMVERIRSAAKQVHRPIGILADLAGPKLRLGQLAEHEIECETGDTLMLRRGRKASLQNELVSEYENLLDEIQIGDKIIIGDGTICLEVTQRNQDEATLWVIDGGTIRSRQGLALPHTRLSIETIGVADYEHATWAAQQGLDFVSLSFVRSPADIRELRRHLATCDAQAAIIAKIEKRESLDCLDEIVAEADGIMVARGDLGLEIDIASTAMVQKKIIAACHQHQKPVIVATQMLESMHNSKRPTRAEVSDISNAILDGADACMLSGETAVGKYPVDSVKMMARIQEEAEPLAPGMILHHGQRQRPDIDLTESILEGAAHVARSIDSKIVVVATKTGEPAIIKSKLRDRTPTLCITDSRSVHGQACLWWGVTPWLVENLDWEQELFNAINDWNGWTHQLEPNDQVVIVSDRLVFPAGHDSILVYELPDSSVSEI